ncbi:MAG TPA: CcmD family protein [Clostridia bacterium]|nr:CcmD family protein [Clostridia bacterium]
MNFLYSAYVVTWVIHIAYLLYLGRRFAHVREEARELDNR